MMMMMAVLSSPGSSGDSSHDETFQYLMIMCSKVTLNTLVLFFWMNSIHRSLLGLFSIFLHVADVMLASAVLYVWLFRESTSASMCFILSHTSTVYAFLPLPILIAAMFDYATYPILEVGRRGQRRTVVYCITVALLWAAACMCSYRYTNTHPVEIKKSKDVKILACRVRGSTAVSHFCTQLSVVVAVVLLLNLKKLISWIRRANQMSEQRNCYGVLDEDAYLSYTEFKERGDSPSLFVSLTLGFALRWTAYLFMCTACYLVGLVVPAYASVNLLWMACVNSALAGTALWSQSDTAGPFPNIPDDICPWKVYWHLGKNSKCVSIVHLADRTLKNNTTSPVHIT